MAGMSETSVIEAPQPPPAAEVPARAEVNILAIVKRLQRLAAWPEIERLRKDMMGRARRAGLSKDEAQAWAYSELDRLYSPIPPQKPPEAPQADLAQPDQAQAAGQPAVQSLPQEPLQRQAQPAQPDTQASRQPQPQTVGNSLGASVKGESTAGNGVSRAGDGLGQIPADWPDLPANAALPVEIAWVQAERLRIVEEQPGKPAVVRLDRARSPAPSWSALAWLETSIRSYAKYVEVAAKAAGAEQDEQLQVRRERMAIEEIRSLLAEMVE